MKKILLGLLMSSVSAFACQDMDKEVRAHTTTWTTLHNLGQLNTNFADSGKIAVSALRTLAIDSKDARIILGDQIHQVLTKGRGAEPLVDGNLALLALSESLEKNETVCDLADRLNRYYVFWGENK